MLGRDFNAYGPLGDVRSRAAAPPLQRRVLAAVAAVAAARDYSLARPGTRGGSGGGAAGHYAYAGSLREEDFRGRASTATRAHYTLPDAVSQWRPRRRRGKAADGHLYVHPVPA